jgi:hypothetical protein
MIVDYVPDPKHPTGTGMLYREAPDGSSFVWYEDAQDPFRRRALVGIATSLIDAHPHSGKPYDRRLAVELATGHHHWLEPEVQVVVLPLRAVPAR